MNIVFCVQGSKGQSVLYGSSKGASYMENQVQLCKKYSTVMQIIVVVLGVKFLTITN